jgi:hypothetical protein
VTKTLSKGPLGLAHVGGSLNETLTLPVVLPELPPLLLQATKPPITPKITMTSRTETVRVFIPFLQERARSVVQMSSHSATLEEAADEIKKGS